MKEKEVKSLTNEEIVNIELFLEKNNHLTSQLSNIDQQIKGEKYKIDIMNYQIKELQFNMKDMNQSKAVIIAKQKNCKNEYQEYIKSLTEKYKLNTEAWGFDPNTGIIQTQEAQDE